MNNNSGRNRQTPPAKGYVSNFTIICVCIIAVLVIVNFNIYSGILSENPDVRIEYKREEDPEAKERAAREKALQTELETSFVKVTGSSDDTKHGNLVLVNNHTAFKFDASPKVVKKHSLVTFSGRQSDKYTVSYPAKETLTAEAMEAFNALAEDFYTQTGHSDLFMLDSYRSYEDQQRVYESKGAEIATVPGNSEHHTGLAFDLELYINGKTADFDGTGDYKWVHDNCHKYGYILRYPHDKTEITEISYEPWHFRYVGKAHAYYMYANNLCLEEYIGLLKKYTLDSERLIFETDGGEKYMVYCQSIPGDSGEIYLPKNLEYEISGDNNGHVIVACNLTES